VDQAGLQGVSPENIWLMCRLAFLCRDVLYARGGFDKAAIFGSMAGEVPVASSCESAQDLRRLLNWFYIHDHPGKI
jgi:hypothetical protein